MGVERRRKLKNEQILKIIHTNIDQMYDKFSIIKIFYFKYDTYRSVIQQSLSYFGRDNLLYK